MNGIVYEGPVQTAEITTGLSVGKLYPKSILRIVGGVVDADVATREIVSLRVKQVGRLAASATMIKCEGRWQHTAAEPSVVCQIEHIPSPREKRPETFQRHMLDLAEYVAERLGQREVFLRMGGELYRASGPNTPAPVPARPHATVIR